MRVHQLVEVLKDMPQEWDVMVKCDDVTGRVTGVGQHYDLQTLDHWVIIFEEADRTPLGGDQESFEGRRPTA